MNILNQNNPQPEYSSNVLIIFYDESIGKDPLLKAIKEFNATIIYDLKIMKSITIKIPEDKKIEEAIDFFQKVDGVLTVNRDSQMQLC